MLETYGIRNVTRLYIIPESCKSYIYKQCICAYIDVELYQVHMQSY